MPINKLSWQASGIYTMAYVCVSHLRWKFLHHMVICSAVNATCAHTSHSRVHNQYRIEVALKPVLQVIQDSNTKDSAINSKCGIAKIGHSWWQSFFYTSSIFTNKHVQLGNSRKNTFHDDVLQFRGFAPLIPGRVYKDV